MQGINVVGVQFRRAGKIYDFISGDIEVQIGDSVLVDSERGPSLARVATVGFHNPIQKTKKKLQSIVRKAAEKELQRTSRISSEDVLAFTKEKIWDLKLKMKLLKAEIQFGGSKVVIYFSSPGRVDFRTLVKELASGLKARVELKQVGARDETKLLGGLGVCGREYCCSSFLREFVPVSIRMAKNQNLAINPSKVSGGCGRLLCCLTYENDVYTHLRQQLPPRGSRVRLKGQEIKVLILKSDFLNQTVLVEAADGKHITLSVTEIEYTSSLKNQEPPEEQTVEEEEEWSESLNLEGDL